MFTQSSALQLRTLPEDKATRIFKRLSPPPLTLIEYILLGNTQLIPIHTYRSLAHNLSQRDVTNFTNLIWSELYQPTPLCTKFPSKDMYSP